MKKNVTWKWSTHHIKEFNNVKQALKDAEILQRFDQQADIVAMTDACERGVGAVLYNKIDGKLITVSCVSTTLTETEAK